MIFFILSFFLTGLSAKEPSTKAEAMALLDSHIQSAIAQRLFPGLCLGLIKKNQTVLSKCYGTKNGTTPTTSDTPYDLASVTKTLVSVRLLQLVEQNKLILSLPYQNYVPTFSGENKELVTLEKILRHQAGLRSIAPLGGVTDDFSESILNILKLPLHYNPGTDTVYSDLGLIMLGYLIESIEQKSLAHSLHQNIFSKLGMSKTKYHFEYSVAEKKLAAPSITDDALIVHDPYARSLKSNALGHAGLFSTLDDMIRYIKALTHNEELLLTSETLELMTTTTSTSQRGLGFDISSPLSEGPRGAVFPKGESFGHTGFTGPMFWVDKKNKVAIVALCNRTYWSDSIEGIRKMKEFRYKLSTLSAHYINLNQ